LVVVKYYLLSLLLCLDVESAGVKKVKYWDDGHSPSLEARLPLMPRALTQERCKVEVPRVTAGVEPGGRRMDDERFTVDMRVS
jgi:hypothetical protein